MDYLEQDAKTNPKILLWGPPGSGKTCLLNAFAREIHFLSKNNEFSEYSLFDKRSHVPLSFLWSKEFAAPTTKAEDFDFVFINSIKKPKLKSIEHTIRVYEDRGDALIQALNQSKNQTMAGSSLQEATHIIALIDLTLIADSALEKHLPKSRQAISKIEYLNYIQRLIQIASERAYPLNMAICLNKMDLSGLRWEDPKTIIEIYLGINFLETIMYHSRGNINISFFVTSAMGYYYDKEGFEHPNYSNNKNGPLHEEEWQPWNVSAPFFWMFDQIERQQRMKQPNKFGSVFRQAEEEIPSYPKPFY